ncbi:unnamed protein product [Rotaria socialis]|uniref:Globin-sensor domain-containing protein n=1 Tax=Rotaria socialis TaxID=392032 RepID=A0A820G7A1_9BILA|nr:unnamed protein product [Rotaria socialis]CAF3230045.1 unnamed protein product [Rotaria socialis]CAF3448567.1 unnamed protein product [Rotaria socialis]CAF4122868.1 unnamed protein product [Rotaria socialis]CAF4271452.1 unnamed protein product [Rotaria socialis]
MTEPTEKLSLDNDLRYRYEYLAEFLNFTNDNIKILNQLSIYIQPMIPVIVDEVYRKLFSFDITKQYFFPDASHSCFGNLFSSTKHSSVSFDGDDIEFRRNMLSKYLNKILTEQEWDDSFLRYLSCVGQVHTHEMGTPTIHVDYMHISALIGFLEHIIIDIILKITNIDCQTKYRAVAAMNKFFWIQNQFLRMHYKEEEKR